MNVEFNLLSNAADSIESAIELIAWGNEKVEASRLKQSIQSIAHGIELLLKERLRRVHPALLWENVDKYPSLNARTVNSEGAAFCKVVVASAVFLSCYFHCRLLPLWVECDGADRLPISRCT